MASLSSAKRLAINRTISMLIRIPNVMLRMTAPSKDMFDYEFNGIVATWNLANNVIDSMRIKSGEHWDWDLDSDVCEVYADRAYAIALYGYEASVSIGEFDVNSCT